MTAHEDEAAGPDRAGRRGSHGAREPRGRMVLAILGALLVMVAGATLFRFIGPGTAREPVADARAGAAASSPALPSGTAAPTGAGPSAKPSATPSGSSRPSRAPATRKPEPKSAAGPSGPCGAFPSFPDASCTGWQHTGVKLRTCNGTITRANTKLDGCRFLKGLTIQAKNVSITRSRVEGLVGATYLTDWSLGGLKLVDVEIDGGGGVDPNGQAAIGSDDYTCIRCHIHGTGRGANMANNVRIEDSYLHGWVYVDGAHQTAIGSNGGKNFTVVHNNLDCQSKGCSSALSLYGDFAPIDGALIEKNLFNTDGGYCTYGGSTSAKPYPIGTNIRYVDNRFGKKYGPKCGYYGPVATFEMHAGNEWRGNTWQDGSGEVKPQS
ncbi:hypothetical protein [Pseudosporangium ferrugineum]|uniref:Parallel beta helix pectate lyase-like protein n=1 Tax=Pseudosporangium ferrugineum TaxID=439699 RepID=A0A2T0SF56_9ACTN|nr:hypothetical protein [Pseudosporangium ferrugineum]PRY32044.1 hypothetical protein CLV70_102255 [Pseudosporangium ferrugineum]